MKNASQAKLDKHEAEVVKDMAAAQAIAEGVFGAQVTTVAVQEIYDYLAQSEEDEFAADLSRVVEHAKMVYKTTAPTPEQVFGIFERIFLAE